MQNFCLYQTLDKPHVFLNIHTKAPLTVVMYHDAEPPNAPNPNSQVTKVTDGNQKGETQMKKGLFLIKGKKNLVKNQSPLE